MTSTRFRRVALSSVALVATTVLAMPAQAPAQSPLGPLNDLLALGQAGGQTPLKLPMLRRAEPPLQPAPRAKCVGEGRREPGIQGRVPAGSGSQGFTCNTELVAHEGSSGGFKVYRYTDVTGRVCAYYDTALLFPLNAVSFTAPPSLGVTVLDMSDPAHPVKTDMLTELPMLSPHESLNVNQKRGLIAAVLGNPATYPGLVSIYDAHADCRHPVLQSTRLIARFGHESGFSEDGLTFYATGTAVQAITAIDVTHPKNPHAIWQGNVVSHGMSLSDDGNRAYVADATGGDMLILDTSEIQARKAEPQAKEISRLTWGSASIPQNAMPFTRDGKPYVLEFDEYNASTVRGGDPDAVGAGRIIDISNEREPRVVSNLRLQVNQSAEHAATKNDPGASSPVQGYAAHYCDIPTKVDPKIVACSFIASGLRVFDISDLKNPKEIAYFVSPTRSAATNVLQPSNFAMSKPAFDVARKEIWYSDGTSGFYNVRVTNGVWPKDGKTCTSRKTFLLKVKVPKGKKLKSVIATVAGKKARIVRRKGASYVVVRSAGVAASKATVVIRAKLRGGKTLKTTRSFTTCAK